jgi:hypothetical protein
MTDTVIEQRDEQVAEAIVSGRSLQVVRKEFGLSAAELDIVLEKLWPIDTQARLRIVKRDVGKLDRLTQVFYEKALAGDVQSGLLTVRIWERLHELLGLDAVQRIDLQIINPPQQVPRHERIREAIMRLTQPEQFQNNGNGPPLDDDGAVDTPSDSDDA